MRSQPKSVAKVNCDDVTNQITKHKHEIILTRWAETGKLPPRRRAVATKKRFIVLVDIVVVFAGTMKQ